MESRHRPPVAAANVACRRADYRWEPAPGSFPSSTITPFTVAHESKDDRRAGTWRCCMNTRYGWGGVARTSRDPPQEPHYGDEVEGSSHV